MQGTSLQCFNKFGQVVNEEKLIKEIIDAHTDTRTDTRWTRSNNIVMGSERYKQENLALFYTRLQYGKLQTLYLSEPITMLK